MRIALPERVSEDAFRRRVADARVERMVGLTMGTTWSALIVAPPPGTRAAIEAMLAELIAELSHWEADSAISCFNRAPVGEWQVLPARLLTVLDAGLALGRLTRGAFDPAAGRLADLWGFGPSGLRTGLPDDAEVASLLASGNAIERDGDRARRMADVALDLSGIAKGFAVDVVADGLEALGLHDFLFEIGGEFVGRGIKPDGQPWWVALEQPPGVSLTPFRVALHEQALATSGDYRRFVMQDGRRLGHTIDRRTGRPVDNGVVSVSVIADDCMMADAWATALTVMGVEAGLALANERALAVRFVMGNGGEYLSSALRAMLAPD
jgi:FAD:protein FMN transferase